MSKAPEKGLILSAVSGAVLLLLLAAAFGFLAGYKKIWPYSLIEQSAHIAKSLIRHGAVVAPGRLRKAPMGASRMPAKVHLPDRAIGKGYYALLGWDQARDAYSVFVRAADGDLVHTIPIDDLAISDNAEHRQNGPHALAMLPDGSAIIGFDRVGAMARFDACGVPIWSRDGYFHHSFAPSADGGLWTWYGVASAYGQKQDLVKFDPETGADITRLALEDLVLASDRSAHVFGLYQGYRFVPDGENPSDIFHPNDIEELLPGIADAFPMFAAGDLMLSLRNIDLVAVISATGQLKWHSRGPWLRQHDPDFEADGRIAVFDNSSGRPRSHILRIDPATGHFTNATSGYAGRLNSEARGKHQLLPNGNRLITVPEQGQALELTPEGKLATEFNNVYSAVPLFNDDLVNVQWFPADYFKQAPACMSR